MRRITKSSAKKKAWVAFSKYIRNFYANNEGLCVCYTCGIKKPWKYMQAGHGIAGRTNSVLFMEEVVRTQCLGCNFYGRGKSSIFNAKLVSEVGIKRYNQLLLASQKIVQYKIEDYVDIEKKYKDKLANL